MISIAMPKKSIEDIPQSDRDRLRKSIAEALTQAQDQDLDFLVYLLNLAMHEAMGEHQEGLSGHA